MVAVPAEMLAGAQDPDRRRRFIHLVCEGQRPAQAAAAAGLSEDQAYRVINRPEVVDFVRAAIRAKLVTEGAVLGYRTLIALAEDEKTPAGVRADCSKALLDRAGLVAPRAEAFAPAERPLHELPAEELRQKLEALQRELGNRAPTIDGQAEQVAPTGAQADTPDPPELADILG